MTARFSQRWQQGGWTRRGANRSGKRRGCISMVWQTTRRSKGWSGTLFHWSLSGECDASIVWQSRCWCTWRRLYCKRRQLHRQNGVGCVGVGRQGDHAAGQLCQWCQVRLRKGITSKGTARVGCAPGARGGPLQRARSSSFEAQHVRGLLWLASLQKEAKAWEMASLL